MGDLIIVTASYDADTDLWSAFAAELGGMFLQATSWKILVDAMPEAVAKLRPRRLFRPMCDIAIEVDPNHRAPATRRFAAPLSVHSPA